MWRVIALVQLAASLGHAQTIPIGTDGFIPPARTEQAHAFNCDRVSASIRITQLRTRLLSDRSNLATANRMRPDNLRLNGRRVDARDFATVEQRIGMMARVEKVEAVCMGNEIKLWITATPRSAWIASLQGPGPIAEPVLVTLRLSNRGLISIE